MNVPESSSPELFVVKREEVVNVGQAEASLSFDSFEAGFEGLVPFFDCKGQVFVHKRFQLGMWRILDYLLSFNQLLTEVLFLLSEDSFSSIFCFRFMIEFGKYELEVDVKLFHFLFHNLSDHCLLEKIL